MGKSKKSKGKKKGSKGKKGKKKVKIEEKEEAPPPSELNTFVYIRRKNLTLCLETHEEETIKELKIRIATILRQFPEDITLFALQGKQEEEMEEKEKPKKEDEKKKEDNNRRSSKGKKEKQERNASPPKPPGDMTIGGYGYNPRTASVFSPAIIGLSYRYNVKMLCNIRIKIYLKVAFVRYFRSDPYLKHNYYKPFYVDYVRRGDDGEFEKLDITPYEEFPVISEEIKMHLRNYVPPPPPPIKKSGNTSSKSRK